MSGNRDPGSVFAPLLDHHGTTAENADWRPRLETPWRRFLAWANMIVLDHGFARLAWKNRERIAPLVWRSNQPSPGDLAFAKAQGVKTVVSARSGIAFGAYPLEREACERLGMAYRVFGFGSRAAPDRALMQAAPDFFASLEYPVLIHCKSGADRAGFLSALYLILQQGMDPMAAAEKHLHWRYGHVRSAKSGILDHVFVHYARANARSPVSFADWLREGYDPEAVAADFRPRPLAELFSSRLAGHE